MRHAFNRKSEAQERKDVYERITTKIVADLERGVRPWVQPWTTSTTGTVHRPLRHNGLPYSGINTLMLWSAAIEHGFDSPSWMTFKQSQELGAHIRKGERGSLVVYANRITKTSTNGNGEEVEEDIPFLRGYTVFNVAQIEGLPPQYYTKPESRFAKPVERISHADAFFRATGADIRERGGRALYSPSGDYIQLPPIDAFSNAEEFYSVLAHEATHWTKGPHRLVRDFGRKRWGDEGYAFEELIAELGAAFLCADLEITPEVWEDHAAYISSWLKVLKGDKHAIFTAASQAQRAADFLHGLQPHQDPHVNTLPSTAEP